VLHNFQLRVVLFHEIDYLGQNFVNMLVMVANTGNAQRSHLPQFLVFHLSHRYIELAAEPGDNRLDNPTLILKRLATGKMKFNPAYTGIHWG